jgi:Sec-independent protein translocase protein TatA
MFNLDPEKIFMIAVVAVIFIGPDKLPGLARRAGEYANRLNLFKERFTQELKSVAPDIPSEEILGQISQLRSIVKPSRYISSMITSSAVSKMASLDDSSANNDNADSSELPPPSNLFPSQNRFGEAGLIWSIEDPRLN